jgi:hypothetical protein
MGIERFRATEDFRQSILVVDHPLRLVQRPATRHRAGEHEIFLNLGGYFHIMRELGLEISRANVADAG